MQQNVEILSKLDILISKVTKLENKNNDNGSVDVDFIKVRLKFDIKLYVGSCRFIKLLIILYTLFIENHERNCRQIVRWSYLSDPGRNAWYNRCLHEGKLWKFPEPIQENGEVDHLLWKICFLPVSFKAILHQLFEF